VVAPGRRPRLADAGGRRGLLSVLVLAISALVTSASSPFIYFRF
jgi:hypothetical protein